MKPLSQKTWVVVSLLTALSVSWVIHAANNEEKPADTGLAPEVVKEVAKEEIAPGETSSQSAVDLDFLYETFRKDPSKMNLVIDSNSPYVDLKREIELAIRMREKKTQRAAVGEEVAARILELGKLQETLSKEVEKKTEANDSLKLLVSLYESISADKVAKILKQMPMPVSLAVMKTMSPRKSSKILAEMEEKYAAEMSRRLLQSKPGTQGGTL